ncbi:18 kDa learning-associated protein of slug [Frankliniella fusca]|uniref:18 kDa learning-associated protein of slug n=1 Tax=Frankliniella fusca TaxID=407009 RepID=A0AAE1LC71_9NEOP|nr:18 kDa learning-associated protein of slug [Frankliniella fusca]
MGKSIRSKRMRRNRNVKRVKTYNPKVEAKLKEALSFEYNDQTEKAHLSIFHDVMNGPPPAVPGLEPGSKIARAHLTEGHVSVERIADFNVGKLNRLWESATRAVTKGARQIPDPPSDPEDEDKMDDKEPRVYDPKTMKDQYGNYPPWMNKKKVKAKSHAAKVQKAKDKRAARRRSGRVLQKDSDGQGNKKSSSKNDDSDESDMEVNFYK